MKGDEKGKGEGEERRGNTKWINEDEIGGGEKKREITQSQWGWNRRGKEWRGNIGVIKNGTALSSRKFYWNIEMWLKKNQIEFEVNNFN